MLLPKLIPAPPENKAVVGEILPVSLLLSLLFFIFRGELAVMERDIMLRAIEVRRFPSTCSVNVVASLVQGKKNRRVLK